MCRHAHPQHPTQQSVAYHSIASRCYAMLGYDMYAVGWVVVSWYAVVSVVIFCVPQCCGVRSYYNLADQITLHDPFVTHTPPWCMHTGGNRVCIQWAKVTFEVIEYHGLVVIPKICLLKYLQVEINASCNHHHCTHHITPQDMNTCILSYLSYLSRYVITQQQSRATPLALDNFTFKQRSHACACMYAYKTTQLATSAWHACQQTPSSYKYTCTHACMDACREPSVPLPHLFVPLWSHPNASCITSKVEPCDASCTSKQIFKYNHNPMQCAMHAMQRYGMQSPSWKEHWICIGWARAFWVEHDSGNAISLGMNSGNNIT